MHQLGILLHRSRDTIASAGPLVKQIYSPSTLSVAVSVAQARMPDTVLYEYQYRINRRVRLTERFTTR